MGERQHVGRAIVVEPGGAMAEIDTSAALAAIRGLLDRSPVSRANARDAVLAAPHRRPPPVLFALSENLVAAGDLPGAARWFYTAQVRAQFDAGRCTDPTAASALGVLHQRFGEPVNRWAFADPQRVRRAAVTAVAWDRRNPHEYDHRWIALHGMGAFTGTGGRVSTPSQDWPALAARVRAEYLQGLRDVLREHFGPGA
ncbi:hypothetical protein [Pseudonocardia sp. HH130630-07]|uniref:hypothetical protein n=1 Tax=Pseudonocardia sp. HH130630-07 TaxID=1690815 RepID=UPI00081519A2|nr:hypothetical protein [Pseudonocardia sp. HH130630-07]ANY07299.1 hypothetical protein AFB00_14555 [Pseudonocardia sp. HH130630-07]